MSTPDELAAQPPPASTDGERVPLIPTWLRVLVVLTVLPVWLAGALYSMVVLDKLPDVAWMAIPSSVVVAVAPSWSLPRRRGDSS